MLLSRNLGRRWALHGAIVAAYLALALVETYPMVSSMSERTPANFNSILSAYLIIEQGELLLAEHPLDLARSFAPAIMAPADSALLFANTGIVTSLVFWPIYACSGDFHLAMNLFILLALTGSAVAVRLLARYWSGSETGGFVAGAVFAFTAPNLFYFADAFFLMFFLPPLVLLLYERFAADGDRRLLYAAAALLVVQLYANLYHCLLLIVLLLLLTAIRWRRVFNRKNAVVVPVCAAISLLLALPLVLFYGVGLSQFDLPVQRDLCWRTFSVAPGEWLNVLPENLLYGGWLHQAYSPEGFEFPGAFFPGVVVLALGVAGTLGRGQHRISPLIVLGILCVMAAAATGWVPLGFHKQPQADPVVLRTMAKVFPLFDLFRTPYRLLTFVALAGAVLCAFGYRAVEGWVVDRLGGRGRALLLVAVTALIALENFTLPTALHDYDAVVEPSDGDRWLASEKARSSDGGAVLHVPSWLYTPTAFEGVSHHTKYLYNNAALFGHLWHRRPVVNGRLSFVPHGWAPRRAKLLPNVIAQRYLKAMGVDLVVVHGGLLRGPGAQRFDRDRMVEAGLEELASFSDGDTVYRLNAEIDLVDTLFLEARVAGKKVQVSFFTERQERPVVQRDEAQQQEKTAASCDLAHWQGTSNSCGGAGGQSSHSCKDDLGPTCAPGYQRIKAWDVEVCCTPIDDAVPRRFWLNPKRCAKQAMRITVADEQGAEHTKQLEYSLPLVVGGWTDEPSAEWDLVADGLRDRVRVTRVHVTEQYIEAPPDHSGIWRLERR